MTSHKSTHKDKLPGGLADKMRDAVFAASALKAGTKVEMEHTDDPQLAKEVAKDHLAEDPQYYKKLRKMEKKAGGYATGSVEVASQVGRRVLPAWSRSKKIPAGAKRAAGMVRQQPFAPGGKNSLIPASSTTRKPLPTFTSTSKPMSMAKAAMLQGMVNTLAKEAGWVDKLKGGAKKAPGVIAREGAGIATWGVGEGVANKLIPRWKPPTPRVKVAGVDKEAILQALLWAPALYEGAKAAGRVAAKPFKSLKRGLAPKSPKIQGPHPEVRAANTPEVAKVAVWGTLARVATKLAPRLAKVAPKTSARLATATPQSTKALAGRAGKAAARDAALGAGTMGAANAASHVARPKRPNPL